MLSALGIAFFFGALNLGLAAWADWRFRNTGRLPVQYLPVIGVIQTAPRRLALFMLPVAANLISAIYLVLRFVADAPAVSNHKASSDLKGIGIVFTTAELIYVFAAARILRRTKNSTDQ